SIIFFFNDTATTEIYTLSLHDALPILDKMDFAAQIIVARKKEQIFTGKHKGSPDLFYDDLVSRLFANHLHLATNNTITFARRGRSEEHTSELQSPCNLVCRLLLEKKKN